VHEKIKKRFETQKKKNKKKNCNICGDGERKKTVRPHDLGDN